MKNKENWIKETQRFQEIAGNPITSSKILSEEYDSFSTKLKNRCLSHIRALRIIAEEAQDAGAKRK